MPQKDPHLLMILYDAIANSTTWQGAVMAGLMAVLRIMYEGKEEKPVRVILEAVLCGALSLCVTNIAELLNLTQSAAITIGGAIGFIGVTALRDSLLKIINKRIDKE